MATDMPQNDSDTLKYWKDLEPEICRIIENVVVNDDNESFKSIYPKICISVLKRQSVILSCFEDKEEQKYFSKILALLGFLIIRKIEQLETFADITIKVINIILTFLIETLPNVAQVEVYDELFAVHLILSLICLKSGTSVEIIKKICNVEVTVLNEIKEEILPETFQINDLDTLFECIQVKNPSNATSQITYASNENWKKSIHVKVLERFGDLSGGEKLMKLLLSSEILSSMGKNYEKVFVSDDEEQMEVTQSSLVELSEYLVLIKDITSQPVMAFFKDPESADSLIQCCLKAALFVASGNYCLKEDALSAFDTSQEDFCRKHGLKATEESLEVFENITKSLSESKNEAICNNLMLKCSMTIMQTLGKRLKEKTRKTNTSSWKWFDGINIMFVTMVSKVMTILSSFLDEFVNESNKSITIEHSIDELDLHSGYTSMERIRMLMSSLPILQIFMDLFFTSYHQGLEIAASIVTKTKQSNKNEGTIKQDMENISKKSDSGGSSEDLSNEEGCIFGNFYVQVVTNGEKKISDEQMQKNKINDAFMQSGEIFLLLAGSLLEFINKFFTTFVVNKRMSSLDAGVLSEQRLKRLAEILKDQEKGQEEITKNVTKLLENIVSAGCLVENEQEALLSEWNLSSSCGSQEWPLYLNKNILSIFTRAVLSHCLEDDSIKNAYVTAIWNSYLSALEKGVSIEENNRGSNVEYMQVLILLFHLLGEEEKIMIFKVGRDVLTRIQNVSIKSPIHLSRLILLHDYMACNLFRDEQGTFIKQVQANVLNDNSMTDNVEYFNSIFKEDEVLKKNDLFGNSPMFFQLSKEERSPDSKVLQLLLSSDGPSYNERYDCYFVILKNLLFEITSSSSRDMLALIALRNAFLQLWNFIRMLPVPSEYISNTKKFLTSKESLPKDCLFYLCWIPKFYDCSKKEEIESIVKIIYSTDIDNDKEVLGLIDSLPKLIHDPSVVILYGKNLIRCCDHMLSNISSVSLLPYIAVDSLVVYFWLLFKKYVIDQKDHMYNVDDLKELTLSVVSLLKKTVTESKRILINGAFKSTFSEEKLKYYMDILYLQALDNTDSSASVGDSPEVGSFVLPNQLRKALKKWKMLENVNSMDLVPTLLERYQLNVSSHHNPQLSTVIGICVGCVVTSHVKVTCYERPFISEGSSLKRCVLTLSQVCKELLTWLFKTGFTGMTDLKQSCEPVFLNLWTDHMTTHVDNQMEALVHLCVEDPSMHDRFEMQFKKQISIIDKWILNEIEQPGTVEENTLFNWFLFLSKLTDHTKTLPIFMDYYNHHQKSILAMLLYGLSDHQFSEEYSRTYISFFKKLLGIGEQLPDTNILNALKTFFTEDVEKIAGWIHYVIFKTHHSDEGCSLLQLFVNFAVQNSCSLGNLLSGILNVCKSYVFEITKRGKEDMHQTTSRKKSFFPTFFNIITTIATAHGSEGHVQLSEMVLQLLNKKEIWLKVSKSIGDPENFGSELQLCCHTLIVYVTKIMSTIHRMKENTVKGAIQKSDPFGMMEFTSMGLVPSLEEDLDAPSEDEKVDEDLGNKICTFTITKHEFMNQHWYHCHTCKMSDSVGCCTVCAKVCHKGHDVTYSKHGSFFCDCGAKEDNSCLAMPKPTTSSSWTSVDEKTGKTMSPFAAWGETTHRNASKKKKKSKSKFQTVGSGKSVESCKSEEDLMILKMALKDSENELAAMYESSGIVKLLCAILVNASGSFNDEIAKMAVNAAKEEEEMKTKLAELYEQEKECVIYEDLMVAVGGTQDSSIESIKLNYSGEQGQTMKQLMSAHVIQHKAMCLIASSNGRRQQIAVAHEKGKITLLQLSSLLKQTESTRKSISSSPINRISSFTMPFTVLNMSSNPMNNDYLAVTGLKDCQLLALAPATSIHNRLVISTKLESGNYIIKALWLPGSQTKLALLTADFVKVFDLSKSESVPSHFFVLPSGKMRDATFMKEGSNMHIIIISSQGHIYTEVLPNEPSHEFFYMMNVLPVEHPIAVESEEILNGGGSSIFYSESLKLLFFSYAKGHSFIGVLKDDFSGFQKVFPLTSSLTIGSPLIQWSDVPGQLGLVHCVHQNNNSIIVICVKPNTIMLQEAKSTAKNVKVQSAICLHQSPHCVVKKTKTSSRCQTSLVVLFEDGHLRLFNANQDLIEFSSTTVKPKLSIQAEGLVPKKPLVKKSTVRDGQQNRSSRRKKKSTTKFPVDFFERCQVTNDVEFGGSDILQVYKKSQVKNRLNTAGMYIANTKPSGFKVEVKNTNKENVVVGVRIQVGVQSLERSPQYMEILGRIVQMRMAKNRWFDVPLTREESLGIMGKNEFTLTFGPSSDPYGLSIVDCIKVYVQTKEVFGIEEANAEKDKTTQSEEVQQHFIGLNSPCLNSEMLFLASLVSVNCSLSLFETPAENTDVFHKLHSIASDFLTLDSEFCGDSSLEVHSRELLRHLYPDESKFKNKKDEIKVLHLLSSMKAAQEKADAKNEGILSMDVLFALLSTAETVGINQPDNFVKYVKVDQSLEVFTNSILKMFWEIHQSVMLKVTTSEIEEKDLSKLSGIVEYIVEILFIVMLGDQSQMEPMTNHITELLLYKDQIVSFGAKQGLAKVLQTRQKTPDATSVETVQEQVSSNEETLKEEDEEEEMQSNEAQQQESSRSIVESQAAIDLPVGAEEEIYEENVLEEEDIELEEMDEGNDEDENDIENDIINNGDLQMLLDDDNAMIEIALALSLQNQDNQQQQERGNPADVEPENMPLPADIEQHIVIQQEENDRHEPARIDTAVVTFPDELPETGNEDLSDGGQESFSNSPTFSASNNLTTTTESTDVAFTEVWSFLLKQFLLRIKNLKELDGLQAIPFLQVLLMLCTHLSDSDEDQLTLKEIIGACIEPLNINQSKMEIVAERSKESEVQLVLMRFLSVLMSRYSHSSSSSTTVASSASTENATTENATDEKSKETSTPNIEKSFDSNVAQLLCERGLVKHCLSLLKNLKSYWQNVNSNGDTNSNSANEVGGSNLLKMKPVHSTPDMNPFFMEQYVKSHALDLFEAFPQLVTEMSLRVPYQIHKLVNVKGEDDLFDTEWTYVLCEYMLMQNTPFVRRQVRKLLLGLCGSKEKYRYVKDLHNLRSHISNIREAFEASGISMEESKGRNFTMSYEDTVSLTESISVCIDIAMIRNTNWKSFCRKEKAILPFLIHGSYQVPEHVASKIIELISLALITKKREKQEKKDKTKDIAPEVVLHMFKQCEGPTLASFVKHFLLESNSSLLRWKAHELIHTIYLNIPAEHQVRLTEQLFGLWSIIPSYGHRAVQFVDLLGFFTIQTKHPDVDRIVENITQETISMLKERNNTLKEHPNSSLYRKLQDFVELDGFYMESDPCLICNNPEMTFNIFKLSSIKADIRYTTKAKVVKLIGNYYISKINLKISDLKRAKMVKIINIFYSNKIVPSAVELKNKTSIWQRAKKVVLSQGQTEVKVELAFPITACNFMIEFVDFYDNAQFSSETLQCPRCSASVPSHPGVCSNCGENVYQCHKCRAINYDEKDPFLCTSCGFCKYGKFEFSFSAHPCCSVEAINIEEDREKALKSVNTALEKADWYYQKICKHRQMLERLLKNVVEHDKDGMQDPMKKTVWNVSALATNGSSGTSVASASSAVAATSINNSIQEIAQRYCIDCKTAFEEMSKVTQNVTAIRKELAQYDIKQRETLSQALSASPAISPTVSMTNPPSFHRLPSLSSGIEEKQSVEEINEGHPTSRCYGCTLYAIKHCLTILRALVTLKSTHPLMLSEGLLQELVEQNLQQQSGEVIHLAQTLLINLTSENKGANSHLNQIIYERIELCLTTQASNMRSNISLHSELSVLQKSISSGDLMWEERVRCVFRLFLRSLEGTNPEVVEAITLPCLEIINRVLKGGQRENRKTISMNARTVVSMNWLNESINETFEQWKDKKVEEKTHTENRNYELMKKYGIIWVQKYRQSKVITSGTNKQFRLVTPKGGWLKLLLFTPSSRQTREVVCTILENMAQAPRKRKMILHMLISYLSELHTAGENSDEYLNTLKNLLKTSNWKIYMCNFGVLESVSQLLIKEVDHLTSLEGATLNFDLAQGYALNALAALMKSFLDDSEVKVLYRGRFVAEVLQCYLALRKLVVQRTKLVDETQEMLSALLKDITSGTEESTFMKTSIETLKKCSVKDLRTPAFIFEQLCDVIHKEDEEASEFFMFLEKDLQQEDYLQGRMQGNPYSSKEPGLGPLMRDVKNKICTECELVALLDDDTGMELLVNNKIISLDLPVEQIYKKIWCAGGNDNKDPMKIVYRMRGLLGDATEDMVESLDSGEEKDIDEENEYQRAGIMAETGGLDMTLKRLSYIRNLSRAQQLVSAILKLLEYCVKVKVNRQYLHQPSVNAMKILLGTLNLALRLEQDHGSMSGGAIIAERVLKLMEIILHEASSEAGTTEVVALPGEESQLGLLLNHTNSPYVRSNPNVLEAMMRLTPFLTFGREEAMDSLIAHFMPFFDFDSFDKEKSNDVTLHLDCFGMIASGISMSASGTKLKDLINERGVVAKMLSYLHSHAPPKSLRASGILDTARWKEFLAKPSLPYILRILSGLIKGHAGTKTILTADENVAILHHLEQVSSEEKVGSLAENLMEALVEFPEGKKKVLEFRKRTRNEKQELAMAMRQKQLESLGMMITGSGQIKAKPVTVSKEMEKLLEEKDQRLVCCICREGYKFYPNKVLGIYTFTMRCVQDEFDDNEIKKTEVYSTVSNFNVIHYDCHLEAVRHARSRDEWESATLQNGNTKCNGLLPIWGPKVSESSFATCLARHNNYIQENTGILEPTFHSTVHDIRLVILRFATQKSFHSDAGGGGKQSNMYLLPYMMHVALYVLNTTRQRPSEEQLLKTFLEAKNETWIASCYKVSGPYFSTVLSLFVMSLDEWKSKKIYFLRRMLLQAHLRNIFRMPVIQLRAKDVDVKTYDVYAPALLFFHLVDRFHFLCKSNLSDEEEWPTAMSNYLRNNDDQILKETEKLLKTFDEEVIPCESFAEFCDVAGLLAEITDPDSFLKSVPEPFKVDGPEVFC